MASASGWLARWRTARRWRAAYFGVYRRKRSYLALAYLVSALPTGLVYVLVLLIGFSTGIGSVVGLPMLILLLVVWWGMARFERELAMWWLGVEIRPMAYPLAPGLTRWARLRMHLRNPVTWKSLFYLFAKLPFGVLTFTLTFALVAFAASLALEPLSYVFDTLLYPVDGGLRAELWFHVAVDGQFHHNALAATLLSAVLGVVVCAATLHLLNGIAWAWGLFARQMLGMSVTDVQLAEARALAAREHAKAERAEQSRRELIVNVSHELRTPIASILGHVESLMMTTDGTVGAPSAPAPAELRGYLGIVHRETERLSALVEDLLALARADASELRLELRPVAVGAVIEEVYQTLGPLARRQRQITVVRAVPPALPPVLADRQRLAQVLLNLVRNAINYTPDGGIISLTAEPTSDAHLAVMVADTGIGIPPEDLERVFERFYRADSSRARTSGGFGLGLAIVRDLVTAMGGSVGVESVVGEGSRFRVLLSVARMEGASAGA